MGIRTKTLLTFHSPHRGGGQHKGRERQPQPWRKRQRQQRRWRNAYLMIWQVLMSFLWRCRLTVRALLTWESWNRGACLFLRRTYDPLYTPLLSQIVTKQVSCIHVHLLAKRARAVSAWRISPLSCCWSDTPNRPQCIDEKECKYQSVSGFSTPQLNDEEECR